MKLIETIELETPGEVQILDYLTLEPIRSGVQISAKSVIIADWMKTLVPKGSMEPSKSTKWGGTYLNIDYGLVRWPGNVAMDIAGGELARSTGGTMVLNLAWLRHTKLDEGIEIKAPIMAAADYEDYLPALSDALRLIYVQNIRKNIMTLRMKEILQ